MPKKKVKAINIDRTLECESKCPYCNNLNYHIFDIRADKEEDVCMDCNKVYIVEIK